MRFFTVAALSLVRIASGLSFSAYDLGFLGVYPTRKHESISLEPPAVQITAWDERCESEGSVLLISPRGVSVPKPGPVMLDARGDLIWMEEKFGQAMNLQVQTFKGQDFITFWSGTSHGPHSDGSYYMLDSTYSIIHTVQAVGFDLNGDLHEFHITDGDTALITVYTDTLLDCGSLGLPGKCWIDDCLFQEISISTGALLFQWRASDHVSLAASYKSLGRDGDGSTPEKAYDFFHINSIEKDQKGNYIISARHMHAIYCISSAGEILWTLGGRNSLFTDLSDGHASNFAWQHHARLHPNDTLSLFDNGGNNVFHKFQHSSQGMLLSLSTSRDNMTVELQKTYSHPSNLLAISQGSMQVLPNGHVLVGWGNTPAFTEFTAEGEVVCDMHFGPWIIYAVLDFGWVKSYRAFKVPWVGRPTSPPSMAYRKGKIYVSWNGATEVRQWVLEAAEKGDAEDDDFIPLYVVVKEGFETSIDLEGDTSGGFVRVVALDKAGKRLGVTVTVDMSSLPSVSPNLILLKYLRADGELQDIPLISTVVFVLAMAGAGFLLWKYRAILLEQYAKAHDLVMKRGVQQEYELVETDELNRNDLRHMNGENV